MSFRPCAQGGVCQGTRGSRNEGTEGVEAGTQLRPNRGEKPPSVQTRSGNVCRLRWDKGGRGWVHGNRRHGVGGVQRANCVRTKGPTGEVPGLQKGERTLPMTPAQDCSPWPSRHHRGTGAPLTCGIQQGQGPGHRGLHPGRACCWGPALPLRLLPARICVARAPPLLCVHRLLPTSLRPRVPVPEPEGQQADQRENPPGLLVGAHRPQAAEEWGGYTRL